MERGDFVKVIYEGYMPDGRLFDTNNPELIKDAEPSVVVVGAGHLIKGLDKVLEEMDVGEEREVVVEPEEAFGKRDPSKVKLIPLSEFRRSKVRPYPGMRVAIDGKEATVLRVTGGRVLVDFNHPLAGLRLRYKIKIIEKIEDKEEKAKGLLRFLFGTDFSAKVDKDTLVLEKVPKELQELVKEEVLKYIPFKNIEFKEVKEEGDVDGEHNQSRGRKG